MGQKCSMVEMNAEERLDFLDSLTGAGVRVFPLGDGGTADAKKPHALKPEDAGLDVRPDGKPIPRIKWGDYVNGDLPDYEELEARFSPYPKSNYAVICGECSGVYVVDADGPAAVRDYEDGKIFTPKSPVYVETGNGRHYYYRWTPEAERSKKTWNDLLLSREKELKAQGLSEKWHFDFRANKGYVVGPLSVHPNGRMYDIPFEDPEEFCWALEKLPAIDKCLVGAARPARPAPVVQPASAEAPKAGAGNLSSIDFTTVGLLENEGIAEGGRNNALTQYVGSLLAQGVTEFGDLYKEILEHNIEFCDPPLGEWEVKALVNSILAKDKKEHPERHPDRATIGREGTKAIAAGAVADAKGKVRRLEKELEEEAAQRDMTGLRLASVEDVATDVWTGSPLLHPGGMFEKVIDYMESSAFCTSRTFCYAGALAFLGALLAHTVKTETNLYTNVYCGAVGLAGSGKEAPLAGAKRLAAAAGIDMMGASSPASGQAVMRDVANNPRQLMTIDEFGFLLGSAKNSTSSLSSFPLTLLSLYTQVDTPIKRSFADGESNYTVYWHGMSMVGSTTSAKFWENVNSMDYESGFLARFMIFEQREGVFITDKTRRKDVDKTAVPPALAAWVADTYGIADTITPKIEGGDTNLNKPALRMPDAVVVRLSDEAFAAMMDVAEECKRDHQYRPGASVAEASMFGRLVENALKVALIYHCTGAPYGGDVRLAMDREISLDSFKYGLQVAANNVQNLVTAAERTVADSEWEKDSKRVLMAIARYVAKKGKEKGHPGATRSTITRSVKNLSPQDLDKHLQGLIDANHLRVIDSEGGKKGKPTQYYCIVEDDPDAED